MYKKKTQYLKLHKTISNYIEKKSQKPVFNSTENSHQNHYVNDILILNHFYLHKNIENHIRND